MERDLKKFKEECELIISNRKSDELADVFNGVLFNGKEVMKPEELENEDSVMVRPENRKVNRESTKTIRGICGVKFSKTRLLFKVKNISFFQ